MKKYFKPKSVTWWAGIALAAVQVVRAIGIEVPQGIDEIIIGVGAIGVRGALQD